MYLWKIRANVVSRIYNSLFLTRVSSEKEKSFHEFFFSQPLPFVLAFCSFAKNAKILLQSVSRINAKFSRNRKCEKFTKFFFAKFRFVFEKRLVNWKPIFLTYSPYLFNKLNIRSKYNRWGGGNKISQKYPPLPLEHFKTECTYFILVRP